jgi:hypothetical protein
VNLILWWDFGTFIYELTEEKYEYVSRCIDLRTLQTVYEVGGNTPTEALEAGVREAYRCVS